MRRRLDNDIGTTDSSIQFLIDEPITLSLATVEHVVVSLPEMNGTTEMPKPLDLSHHYSRVTKNRNASSVKGFYKYFSIPGIGNLAGGSCFSFQTRRSS